MDESQMHTITERLEAALERVVASYGDRQTDHICVYHFRQAPQELRDLSPHGGDEDWLAVVPPEYEERHFVPWLAEGSPFGVCSVSKHELLDGTTIYIGAH